MNWSPSPPDAGLSRRSFLAAGATGAAVTTGGCIDRVQSVVGQAGSNQLSVSITTVPADADRQNVRIANRLKDHLEQVGIGVSIDMRSRSEMLSAVLIDHDFDIYVGHHPADYDPDFLYESLHSTFASEAGWQNPFGFTRLYFDRLLEEQRQLEGEKRNRRIESILWGLAREKPFEPICVPDEYRVASTDRFDGWEEGDIATRYGYLGLEPAEDVDDLHALVTDSRLTTNLNPLSAPFRNRGTTIDLLYDSLGTEHGGEVTPWLATSWEWTEESGDAATATSERPATRTATITLQEECQFHDGEPVTAHDVAFTYRFLADTSLGRAPIQSPATRYRGHVDIVDEITVESDDELTITITGEQAVGERAFTVPILPEHVWRERVNQYASDSDFTAPQGEWAVVTADNIPPVGSGPFQFDERTEDESLVLTRFDEHFTQRDDVALPEATVDELRFTVEPSSAASIGRVADSDADVTASMLSTHSLPAIPDSSAVERLQSPSRTFYHVGFNVRNAPFSNSHFRRAITQLLDKEAIVEEVFYGNATPAATPVTGEWLPSSLEWGGEDPVTPFPSSDGDLNVEAAKAAFERAGFRYDDNGRLLEG
ncbi:ABC transporter substrate-binding protein [Natrinema longum]|uniref:ABC transporter substrate-binding protein n=1 Tax=Natrinema longum TaxID=370324 RepID=A0A8A2UDJ6_9EURY|nr:ABC transporter substrate-binding protein [Natrinema longum]MBZ6496105.1 ABC transporter substrate-binding protein [Natrinema longum]QSW85968.1 ABC transporter substrate-binding protein [Natrinema longum]